MKANNYPNVILLADRRMIGYTEVGLGLDYNVVKVYHDGNMYSVEGRLPMDELISIASSLE